MVKQVYYEDVEEGFELPSLAKRPTARQLVMWAGVSEDFTEIHYDKDIVQSLGLPERVVHGQLTKAFLAQLITDWIGELGTFRKLSARYQGMFFVNEDIICKGKVSKKYIENGEHYVECEVWAENSKGEKYTLGTALVILPSHESATVS